MSRTKTKNTFHSYDRAAERCGLDRAEAKRLFSVASKMAFNLFNFPEGPLKDYIIRKGGSGKRIKYLEGYIFVFCKTSTRCLTMYKVKDNVLKAQEAYDRGELVEWCNKCKQYFTYDCQYQTPGCRDESWLNCPSCGETVRKSMEYDYFASKIE